jgi:hypothetical protein
VKNLTPNSPLYPFGKLRREGLKTLTKYLKQE